MQSPQSLQLPAEDRDGNKTPSFSLLCFALLRGRTTLSLSLPLDGEKDTGRSKPVPCARARTRSPRLSDSVPPVGVPTGGSAIQGEEKFPPEAFRRQGGAATGINKQQTSKAPAEVLQACASPPL